MKLLKKIDDNILKGLLALFLFFVPLYMKFPLQNVTFTYISIRIDDLFSLLLGAVFVIQLLRGKVSLRTLPFKKYFAFFWVSVFVSMIFGLYISNTIEYTSIGFLHAARRVEYMMFFFIAYASVKSIRDFKMLIYICVAGIFLADIYGFGQRLYSFPAVSTMNPEFAKGRILYLTPEARLSSTFAGHYDLGAYLVFFMPILWALYFRKKDLGLKIGERIAVFFAALTPFVVNIIAMAQTVYGNDIAKLTYGILKGELFLVMMLTMSTSIIIFLLIRGRAEKWLLLSTIVISVIVLVSTASRTSSIAYLVSISAFLLYFRKFRYFVGVLALSALLTYQDPKLVQRWSRTVQLKEIIINQKTGEQVVVQKIRSDELPAGTAFLRKNRSTNASTASALLKEELILKAGTEGGELTASEEAEYETYTALAGDISLTTRFQVSWPRAMASFARNPFFGTGASSITESSDGDYVRWLGETGIFGFIGFLGIIGCIMKRLFDRRERFTGANRYLLFAVFFGTGGLLINALLIDVFEASKVAYAFWIVLGMFIALATLKKSELESLDA